MDVHWGSIGGGCCTNAIPRLGGKYKDFSQELEPLKC